MNRLRLLEVKTFNNPCIITRTILPYEKEEDRNKKPFQTLKSSALKITWLDRKGREKSKTLTVESGFCYDGATIPFGLCKGNMKLLIPSMWHDKMCNEKRLINFDRQLSSLIFRELLLQCGVNKFAANLMYIAVDNWQKLIKGWKKYDNDS